MNKLRQAVQLALSTGMSNRAIGRDVEIAFNSVRRYREIAAEKGYTLESLQGLSDEEFHKRFNKRPLRHPDKRVPDFNTVHVELQRPHMTLQLLWEEYLNVEPDTAYRYSQFTHLYREWAQRSGVVMRQEHAPGERGWVDFLGPTMSWVDKDTGEEHKVAIFAAALGVSHLLYALAIPSQATEWWIEAHNQWYAFLGAVPKITVPDNLKAGVIKTGKDQLLNPTYLEMGQHYRTVILPARPRKPKDKAKVEGGVLILERWALARLRNRVFHSLAEINEALKDCLAIINAREMRVFKQSRQQRYDMIDLPAMLGLPETPFLYGEWVHDVRVARDHHVCVRQHHYSVPYRLIGEAVNIRVTATVVEIYYQRQRIASHVRDDTPGTATTDATHRPDTHRAWADQTEERFQAWAKAVGQNALAVVNHQFANVAHAALALKACSRLEQLSKQFGAERFEAACGESIRIKSPNHKSIRSLLQNRLEGRGAVESRQLAAPQMPEHGNVRGPNYYLETEDANAA